MEVSIENTADFEQKLENVLDSGNSPKRKGPPKTDSDSDDGLSAELGAVDNLEFLPQKLEEDSRNASRSSLGNVIYDQRAEADGRASPDDDIPDDSEILDESSSYSDEGSESSIVKRFETMHMQLTEVLRNDLKLDESDRIPEEEWRRTSPLIFAGDEDPTGSSITASEADGNFIGGWNDIERLDTSAGGESITIRLKIKNDESFDLTDENDDSIELDPKAYEGLKDLLRRAEQSHKLSREVIAKQSSPSPVSECGSSKSQTTLETTPVSKPRPKPKKLYEDDISNIKSAHAQELLNFLRSSSGVPPALSAVSSSNSSVSGSPSRELRLEVIKAGAGASNSFPLSPPPSSPSRSIVTAIEEEKDEIAEREINPVVIVESKRARRERMRKAKQTKKEVTIRLPEEEQEKEKEKEKEKQKMKASPPKVLVTDGNNGKKYENPYSVLQREEGGSAFMPVRGSPKEKARTVRASPIGVSSSSKKKKAKGRRGSKVVDEDLELLNSLRTTTFWRRNRSSMMAALAIFFVAVGLYYGGYHDVQVEDSSALYTSSSSSSSSSGGGGVGGVGKRGNANRALNVDVTSPVAGGVLKSSVAPLAWRMTGAAIVPGEEVQISIIMDNIELQSNKVTLPSDAVENFVDGSIDIQLDTSVLLRGTHNITIKCNSAENEAVGTSIFLYMPDTDKKAAGEVDGHKAGGGKAKEAKEVTEVVRNQVKLELTQPTPGAVINGDTMVLKFKTLGFDMGVHSSLVKVVLILDGGQEYTLEQNVQTISGLSNGPHKLQLFVILKETMEVLYADETQWNHVQIENSATSGAGGGGEEVLVDGEGLKSINNSRLIELADASGISTSVRLKILNELEKRFEEFQRLYYE
ncbi:hypothetical protein TrVE_jg10169 [Triparma verrucosa]|uniref:Uncharacterized protein n=1 Tax=Triparma verrucosa TaxID=1606542 RepID=A0A9W7ENT8_9STRA|nr:hypothetical protein TrVE_jg10169 [Triparma verrucosa]